MDFTPPHYRPLNEDEEPLRMVRDQLETLYTLNLKAVEGFQKAAEDLGNVSVQDALRSFADVHQTYAQALATQLSTMGAEPDTDAAYELVGDLHQTWIDFMQAITGADTPSIIGECITGETVTRNHYHDVLTTLPADAEATSMLNAQYEGVIQIVTKLEQMQAAYDNLGE